MREFGKKLGVLNAFYRSLGVDLHLPPNIDFDEGAGQEQNVPTKPESSGTHRRDAKASASAITLPDFPRDMLLPAEGVARTRLNRAKGPINGTRSNRIGWPQITAFPLVEYYALREKPLSPLHRQHYNIHRKWPDAKANSMRNLMNRGADPGCGGFRRTLRPKGWVRPARTSSRAWRTPSRTRDSSTSSC